MVYQGFFEILMITLISSKKLGVCNNMRYTVFKFFFPTLFLQVLHQHNDTLSRLEAASSSAYGYALGITVGLGGILCFLNGMLLLCLCQKRASSKRRSKLDDPTGNEYLHFV